MRVGVTGHEQKLKSKRKKGFFGILKRETRGQERVPQWLSTRVSQWSPFLGNTSAQIPAFGITGRQAKQRYFLKASR